MSIGSSGRIVIELEPSLKRQIYSALAKDGLTLKEWFVREAETYIKTTSKNPFDSELDANKVPVLKISQ